MKQKQKWYWRKKNVYLKNSIFSYMRQCDEYFYAETIAETICRNRGSFKKYIRSNSSIFDSLSLLYAFIRFKKIPPSSYILRTFFTPPQHIYTLRKLIKPWLSPQTHTTHLENFSSPDFFVDNMWIMWVVKEFLDIQANKECGFTLKLVRDMTKTYSQLHCTDKYTQHSSII